MSVKKKTRRHSGLRLVVADCDASLAAPGAQVGMVQDMDVSPGQNGWRPSRRQKERGGAGGTFQDALLTLFHCSRRDGVVVAQRGAFLGSV